MGIKNRLWRKKVYFDTNIFIYLLEGNEEYKDAIAEIRNLIENSEIQVFGSELVYTELLPPHAKKNNLESIEHTITFMRCFELIPMDSKILILAGILRGKTGMKTPDAIHVTSAMESNCEIFLTNDKNIRTPNGLNKIQLSEYRS